MPSAHGPLVAPGMHFAPVGFAAAYGWLFSKSKNCPQIVWVPPVPTGHGSFTEHPPPPVPMQVTTPISSTSGWVVSGSHNVGGKIGTQRSPCSSVNGPHCAVPTVSLDGTHRPLRSVVPAPQSTFLQPAADAVST